MKTVIGVKFRKPGKVYFFDPENMQIKKEDYVIVETSMGEEIGKVVIDNKKVNEEKLANPLKKVIRLASKKDLRQYEENKKKEPEALKICEQKIKKHKLNMRLIDVEYKFDNSKILFYFTAEGRVDFRDLVKDLASVFKTRIELRQIGVRDEVRRIGGNGICGRELCCCSFLGNFETVSIKMAKEQNISLNPAKISGNCGRLMCCLKYEQEVYEEKLKRLPKVGAIVKTEDGEGTVEEVETLKEKVKVKVKDGDDYFYKKYDCSDIKIIKNIEKHKIDPEEKEHQKELEELEKLEKEEKGIYIYNLQLSKMEDYIDFKAHNFDGIQGDNATFVNVSNDGMCIEINNNSIFLQYHTKTKQIDNKKNEVNIWNPKIEWESIDNSDYYSVSDIYEIEKGEKCFLALKKNVIPNYGALIFVTSNKESEKRYSLFDI